MKLNNNKYTSPFFLAFFSSLISFLTFSQDDHQLPEVVSDCKGAVTINRPGNFSMSFTGDMGYINDLEAYPSLSKMQEKNSIWAAFTAPFEGTLSITSYCHESVVEMVVFKAETSDGCGDIQRGIAEIERMISNKDRDSIGLDYSLKNGFLYPIKLNKGEQLLFYFNTEKKSKAKLDLTIAFEASNLEDAESELTKTVDMRDDEFQHYLEVTVRDAETGLPVKGNFVLKGTKSHNALYYGSDFFFPAEKKGTISFSIDAEGYFYYDREETLDGQSDHEVTVWLEPAYPGRKFEIRGLEFKMGSTELLPSADGSLKRLRDFLLLNDNIDVEIQGHVHSDGDNSFAAQRMSVARAKRVKKYLISSGIDRNRLSTKGFGNEKMIYPNAKLVSEEQANRRVEIEILSIEEE